MTESFRTFVNCSFLSQQKYSCSEVSEVSYVPFDPFQCMAYHMLIKFSRCYVNYHSMSHFFTK